MSPMMFFGFPMVFSILILPMVYHSMIDDITNDLTNVLPFYQ
jgi:hypothetical protein